MGKKYSCSYEIVRYEVRLLISGSDLGGNNYFDTEEDAIAFALEYEKEHPKWTATILRVERIVFEEAENK